MSDNYTQELDLNIKPRSSDLLPSHLNLTLPMNTNLGVEWHAILFWSFPTSRTVARLESTLWVERSFFYLRRNNLRPKQLACWPPLYSDAFENIDEPRTPYSVMIAETIFRVGWYWSNMWILFSVLRYQVNDDLCCRNWSRDKQSQWFVLHYDLFTNLNSPIILSQYS